MRAVGALGDAALRVEAQGAEEAVSRRERRGARIHRACRTRDSRDGTGVARGRGKPRASRARGCSSRGLIVIRVQRSDSDARDRNAAARRSHDVTRLGSVPGRVTPISSDVRNAPHDLESARSTILAATCPDCIHGGTPSPKTPAPAKNRLGKKVELGKRKNIDWSGVIAGP